MSDGVENGQQKFDADLLRCDSTKGGRNHGILTAENCAQIQKHASFLDARDNGRIGRSQTGG
jgi:hypothetical protein